MATQKDYLRVGDTVKWRGGFGNDAPKDAKIESIEVCPNGSKYGTQVDKIEWSKVNARNVVIDLDNRHWCYGTQITKK
jgi:hypothetical protein